LRTLYRAAKTKYFEILKIGVNSHLRFDKNSRFDNKCHRYYPTTIETGMARTFFVSISMPRVIISSLVLKILASSFSMDFSCPLLVLVQEFRLWRILISWCRLHRPCSFPWKHCCCVGLADKGPAATHPCEDCVLTRSQQPLCR